MPGESDLRFRFTATLQQTGAQLQSGSSGLQLQGSASDQLRLIEFPLTQFSGVQRNRHHQNFFRGKKWLQIFDRLREHASQHIRRRTNLVVFEQMNQLPQSAFITPVGGGLDVWRFKTAAQSAKSLAGCRRESLSRECKGAHQSLAADGAESASDRRHRMQAIFTHWKPGNVYQGSTAEATIGRKQRREQGCGNAARPGDQWIILLNNPGPGGPNWGPVTAEDDPPSPSRGYGGSDRTNPLQYSGA